MQKTNPNCSQFPRLLPSLCIQPERKFQLTFKKKKKNTTYLYTTPKTNLSSKIELEYKVKIVHYCYIEYNSKIVHNGKMYRGKLYSGKMVHNRKIVHKGIISLK